MKIIAEIGVNHNGSIDIAKNLIVAAKENGADIVKFQTFKAEDNISKYAELADYQKTNMGSKKSQLEIIKNYEFSEDAFIELHDFCLNTEISFLSTAFDINALKFLDNLSMPYIKIPSGEVTNLPLLEEIGQRNRKVLLSTGMCEFAEVVQAIEILENSGQDREKVTVLQCTSQYPASDNSINLNSMVSMGKKLGLSYGLSDHSKGITASVAAAALGAAVTEKHITFDKNDHGPDHKASIDINELKNLFNEVKRVKDMLGESEKKIQDEEKQTKLIARKSLVASKDLKKGHVLKLDDILIKRPGSGISPMRIYEVIGLSLTRDVKIDEVIKESDIAT